jgi:hypothetical protein
VHADERTLERAQLVWQQALEPVSPLVQHDHVALALLRASDLDSTTMDHALALGRARLRENPHSSGARAGILVLERAIAFLGVKSAAGEVAGTVSQT